MIAIDWLIWSVKDYGCWGSKMIREGTHAQPITIKSMDDLMISPITSAGNITVKTLSTLSA